MGDVGGGGARRAPVFVVLLAAVLAGLLAAGPAAAADRAWTDRALALQVELADDVPLRNAPWVSTHNSFNSIAEMGLALSALDPNQQLTLVEQLDAGVRHLEIDVHPALAPLPELGLGAPTSCHTVCTLEKPFQTVLGEIGGWLRAHRDQVLLLYVESHLESTAGSHGYDAGARAIEATLGDLVHRPAGGGARCAPLPLTVTRRQILAAGHQVLIFGPCGSGRAWPSWVHDERGRLTGGDNGALREPPDCGPDFTRAQYEANPVRYFEDRTIIGALTAGPDPIDAPLTRRMVRCGVDIIGLDQLTRDDPRREALVWSWAPGQPAAGDCAVQRPDGRWASRPCGERHRVACRDGAGRWTVPATLASAATAPRACRDPGTVNGVPRTGREGWLLQATAAGAGDVWLGLRQQDLRWRPSERGDCAPALGDRDRPWRVRRGVATGVVRLRFPCTGERLRRSIVVRGGRRTVRARTDRRVRVAVGRRTRRLSVRFAYRGRTVRIAVALRRG
ncbi:hypothetical protein [Patulibacter defluvii]|uniref:hypothetical protein n=1 Tax=Patulibacter defluvii TaxID=3095358 RepID=UPI002A75B046|nr:hypothetical protein [Patulibacter sp. DM4]